MSKNYNNEDGVWRTIGGRRVFIRNGQDLASAMKESGKFKKSEMKNPEIDKKENRYATNNKGGIDDNSSEFAEHARKHWEKENEKYKEKYGKDDEMAKNFAERWERERKNRVAGEEENSKPQWQEVESKYVTDSDGFTTEYTLYKDEKTGKFQTIFGDKDLYNPDSDADADMEFENEKEAKEWFNSYNGFEDEVKEELKALKSDNSKESISNAYDVYEDENGYRGTGKELKKFIQAEEKDSGVEASKDVMKQLDENPNKEFVYDNQNDKLIGEDEKEYDKYKQMRLEDPSNYTDEQIAEFNRLDKKYLDKFSKEEGRIVNYRGEYAVLANGGIQKTFKTKEEANEFANKLKSDREEASAKEDREYRLNNAIGLREKQEKMYDNLIENAESDEKKKFYEEAKNIALDTYDKQIERYKNASEQKDYDNLNNNEVYEEGMKFLENSKDFDKKMQVNKLLDRIDRANKRGEGYSNKATNELRDVLKGQEVESKPKTTNKTMNDAIRDKASKKRIPNNLSKDIYELDADKGNAWSGNAPTKNANGDQFVRVRKNGTSQNSAEDIANAMTKKYPHLEAKVINDNEVDFSVKKSSNKTSNETMNEAIREKATAKLSNGKYVKDGDSINYKGNLQYQDRDGKIKNETKLYENVKVDNDGNVYYGDTKLDKDRIISVDDRVTEQNRKRKEEMNNLLGKSKSSNKKMNEAIRSKVFKDDLPKKVEIKEQGTSNRKEVSENIQAHILDYYDSPEDFTSQMEYMKSSNMWRAGKEIAEGGSYLIYNEDMSNFLNDLKINPKGKTFSDDKAFDMYTSLVGRESERLYKRIKKNAYNKYKKEHPMTEMSFEEFVEQSKKYK